MVFVSTNKGMCTPGGMSPGKKVELRSQYLKQLKEIQNLKDEGVLTIEEFQAEKDTIHLTIPMHYVTLYVVVYYMQGLWYYQQVFGPICAPHTIWIPKPDRSLSFHVYIHNL